MLSLKDLSSLLAKLDKMEGIEWRIKTQARRS